MNKCWSFVNKNKFIKLTKPELFHVSFFLLFVSHEKLNVRWTQCVVTQTLFKIKQKNKKANLNPHEFENLLLSLFKQCDIGSRGYRCENIVHSMFFFWIQVDPWGNLIYCHLSLPLVLGHRLWKCTFNKKNTWWVLDVSGNRTSTLLSMNCLSTIYFQSLEV